MQSFLTSFIHLSNILKKKEDKRAKKAKDLKERKAAGGKANEATEEANNSFVYKSRPVCFVQRQVCRIFTILLYK